MRNLAYKIIVVTILAIVLAAGWLSVDYLSFLKTPLSISTDKYIMDVPQGGNLGRLARKLSKEGIISSRRYLVWYAYLTGNANNIKMGEYELTKDMTPVTLMAVLNQGKVIQYSFTIVDGWTFKQMIAALKTHPQIRNTVLDKTPDEIMRSLGLADMHPEGRFLPDTYFFPNNTTDIEFLKRAYKAMDKLLSSAWPQRKLGLAVKTPYQALILASIVEKETALASERKEIAGVFNRRLLRHIRLQTDPTVIYGLGEKFDGNLRRRDLMADTPYNTYRHYGLPPTPIALPGKESIEAVLHPDEGDKLYFVSRGDGSHYFSSNLKEHNEAVIKYQLKGRRKKFSSSGAK